MSDRPTTTTTTTTTTPAPEQPQRAVDDESLVRQTGEEAAQDEPAEGEATGVDREDDDEEG